MRPIWKCNDRRFGTPKDIKIPMDRDRTEKEARQALVRRSENPNGERPVIALSANADTIRCARDASYAGRPTSAVKA